MNAKLKLLMRQLLQSPRRFPVEAALGVVFFVIAVWNSESSSWDDAPAWMESAFKSDILWLFVPLVVLSFWLQRVSRWAYLASFFLFLPLMTLDLKPFLWTFGFAFTYILAGILLVVGNRRMDDRPFAAHALHVVTQMFFGLLITGLLNMALMAIVASFLYIFGIDEPKHLYEHIIQFVWFVLAPQVCCTLVRQGEDEVSEPARVLQLILNYILSPAIIIYTVILYTYFIMIVFQWDLPRGGVAWMVMGFITAALAGHMAQSILSERYYDWFYRHFTLIAIPPLIMYWVGSIYRIRLYSFTESRFYLMVAGVLMTLFVLMLWRERTRRYQLMALILGAALILFTYIPSISAKSIGLSCQKQRLTRFISNLGLADAQTGLLVDEIDLDGIRKDSLLCEQYRDVASVIDYVRKEMGTDEFKKQYGEWTHSSYAFHYDSYNSVSRDRWISRDRPLDVGEYRMMMPPGKYDLGYDDRVITVKNSDGETVLTYPVHTMLSKDTALLHYPERLMTHHNDSILLILESICINDSTVTGINYYDFHLFKKPMEEWR